MKTPFLALVFSLVFTIPNFAEISAGNVPSDSLKNATGTAAVTDDEADLTVDEKILFQEKVYIHIYDQSNQPVISGEFSRKELRENQKLSSLLRKSTRFLNIDHHHYYYVNEG